MQAEGRKENKDTFLNKEKEITKMMKKIAALLLCVMLCLSAVSFAAAEDVPNLAGTYYS